MRFPDLSLIPFLRDVSDETLAQLRAEIDWFSLPGGMTLFEAGDVAEAIYFVTSGALGAFRRAPNGEQELLGYIRSGEPVGEMALIAGETHSASVYAVRDTEIVRLNRAAFFRFVRQQPSVMHNLARIMLARSRLEKRRSARAEPKVFAFFFDLADDRSEIPRQHAEAGDRNPRETLRDRGRGSRKPILGVL
jgi:cAMP-binding proteins - catabolite gene activator and regulatory subunit of cAMP-dependent protein kinases